MLTVFTKYGFCNWKKALDKGQVMYKHAASLHHNEAVKLWRESSQRAEHSGLKWQLVKNRHIGVR